ncbi:MAG: DUF3426 domain-containing protein [Alphaproteobacteria bacterium]
MIVTCPSCATRYLVDPAALGEAGRLVRCARCAHTWTETPPEDMPRRVDFTVTPDTPQPIPPGSNLPALPRIQRSRAWIGWLFLVGVVVGVVGAALAAREQVITAWPETSRFYALVGLAEPPLEESFELRDVKQSSFIEDDRQVVIISGQIVNVSTRSLATPRLIARIFDKDSNVLSEWRFDPVRAEIGPGESTEFSDRFSDPPKGAVNLVVSLAREE